MALSQNGTPTVYAAKTLADVLPSFNGDPLKLETFIQTCDNFYRTYGQTTDNTLNDYTFSVIRSKLQDNVLNFIMCRPDLNTWPLIRETLKQNFGDRIDRQTLTKEFLQSTKGRNENILDFLARISQIKSRLEVKINAEQGLSAERKAVLIEQNEGNSVDILLCNVDEKTRTILEIHNPGTFIQASDILTRQFYNDQRIQSLNPLNKYKGK
ncbi:uncharacterized protein [Diabrotica undecimpunctata]|uniref:uncharacterized protein n=1 Tax=Diabrotica undecimpunctata TaxID=50387 RepID=UPI003B6401DC